MWKSYIPLDSIINFNSVHEKEPNGVHSWRWEMMIILLAISISSKTVFISTATHKTHTGEIKY